MADLGVVILTFNEERHIERCIRSLQPVAKEILVIDSCSTDKTVQIAEALGARVTKRAWPGSHAAQFQWGLDNGGLSAEWIMKIDADEYLLPELAKEIEERLDGLSNDICGIYIKRRVVFMGKWIKYGGYYPTWLLRIWRRGRGFVEQRWMDEHIKLTSGESVRFEHDFVDENLNGLTAWTQKHNDYATKEAIDILNTLYGFTEGDGVEPKLTGTQEERKRWLKMKYLSMPLFLRPLLYFTWRYFARAGFLDGREGLVWHTLQGGWYRFLVDAKLMEIYHRAGRDRDSIIELLEKEYDINFEGR